jgi:hypothetical protein
MSAPTTRALGSIALLCVASCREQATVPAPPAPAATTTSAVSVVTRSIGTTDLHVGSSQVTICPKGAACRTIVPTAFSVPRADAFERALRDAIPCDLREDGGELFVVRHEGRRGEAIFGEAYDAATGARRSRIPLVADQHVDRVRWVGTRVLTIACIDDGPGCVGALVEPHDGRRTPLDGNFYAIDPPATRLDGDRWAFVTQNGARVEVRDVAKDVIVRVHDLASHAGPEEAVRVALEPTHRLVLSFAGGGRTTLDLAP